MELQCHFFIVVGDGCDVARKSINQLGPAVDIALFDALLSLFQLRTQACETVLLSTIVGLLHLRSSELAEVRRVLVMSLKLCEQFPLIDTPSICHVLSAFQLPQHFSAA